MKNYRFPVYISLIILISLLLSSCTGTGAVNNWPGVSANQDVVYLSYQGAVYAVNAENGTMIWRFPKDKPDASKPFFAAPAFSSDGVIVVGNYGNTLYALNTNGEIKWQYAVENANFVATPLVLKDVILAPASDDYLYAVSLDGMLRWKYKATNSFWAQPASDGDLVFQASLDHYLYALRVSDGSLVWKKDLESSLVSAPVLNTDGKLFISTMGGDVVSLNSADGAINWKFPTKGSLWSSPVLYEGTLFVGNSYDKTKGSVIAISLADGKKVWEKDAGGPVVGGGALLVDSESVAFPTETGNLAAWALTDGAAKWTQIIGGKLYSTPVIVGDHLVVAVAQGDNKILQAVTFNGQISWPFALPK
ncbi:MAG: PQQ-binding-like beta-propeller repeat protein [Anaerolineaceae bacterium]|nr:PQQ-binding-like beta-propeller repeat protein [Anaerolineaceae bacterium]